MIRRVGALVCAAVLVAACAPGGGSGPVPSRPAPLVVFAAASLRDALREIRTAYRDARPQVTIELSIDASSTLATQIIEGAPADVFLSADEANPQRLADAGLGDGPATTFAENELAIITPSDDPAGIAAPADLGRPGVRIIAAGASVPITRYAEALIDRLAADPGAAADYAARYADNIVSREDNVKAVVAKIELGEGDAGIVYRTDAAAAERVRVVEIPAAARIRARYDGVVVAGSRQRDEAQAFLVWLRGADGQRILTGAGFRSPS